MAANQIPTFMRIAFVTLTALAVFLTVTKTSAATVTNDFFAGRTPIYDTNGILSLISSNVGAGPNETNEPAHAGRQTSASVWWHWSPTQPGQAVIEVSSTFERVVAVYKGKGYDDPLASYQVYRSPTNRPLSRIEFDAAPPNEYEIVVASLTGDTGQFRLSLTNFTKPVFVIQPPRNLEISERDSAEIEVVVIGRNVTEDPLRYQWRFNGTNLPGETNSKLEVKAATKINEGRYSVTVANSYGITNSGSTIVAVVPYPRIAENPKALEKEDGDDAEFTVKAFGGDETHPLFHQWEYSPTLDGTFCPIQGATFTNLFLTNLFTELAGYYQARVTLTNPPKSALSLPAKLTVNFQNSPRLTGFTNITVVEGTPVNLLVTARGHRSMNYQWMRGKDAKITQISGATAPLLSFPAAKTNDSDIFQVFVSNRYGTNYMGAELVVEPRPPNDNYKQRIDISHETNAVYGFNKFGSYEPGEPNPLSLPTNTIHSVWWSYQTQKRGVVTIDLAKSTVPAVVSIYTNELTAGIKRVTTNDSASHVVFVAEAGIEYAFLVDGRSGQQAGRSENDGKGGLVLRVTFDPNFGDPILDRDPVGIELLGEGGGSGGENGEEGPCIETEYNLSVGVQSLVPVQYRWQYNLRCLNTNDIASGLEQYNLPPLFLSYLHLTYWLGLPCIQSDLWVDIPGATNNSLVLKNPSVAHSGLYRLIVNNIGVPGTVTSAVKRLIVSPIPLITSQPSSIVAKACERKELHIGFLDGCNHGRTEWYFNSTSLRNQTNNSLIFTNGLPTDSGTYFAVARNSVGGSTSAPVRVSFDPRPVILVPPQGLPSAAADCGEKLLLSVKVEQTQCLPSLYQWYHIRRQDPARAEMVPNETNNTILIPPNAQTDGKYFVRVYNSYTNVDSAIADFPVSAAPRIIRDLDPDPLLRIFSGGTFTNTIEVQSCSGLTYQWRKNGNPIRSDTNHIITTNEISNRFNFTLTVRNAVTNDSGSYDVAVSNILAGVTSKSAMIEVRALPPNDLFRNRTRLSHILLRTNEMSYFVAEATGYNFLATSEDGEPDHAKQRATNSVWWTWTSPSTPTMVTLDVIGGNPGIDPLLAVYTGDRIDGLTSVDYDDQSAGNDNSRVTFGAAPNKTFQIAVDGLPGRRQQGDIGLRLVAQEMISEPIIRIQPFSRAVTNGQDVTLSVRATGSPDIQYQWYFNTKTIPNAIKRDYHLPTITTNNEGAYFVTLANSYGTNSSFVAQVTFGLILEGQVFDATNTNAVPNAEVSIGPLVTNTDYKGHFTLVGVRPGEARADFEADRRVLRLKQTNHFSDLSTLSRAILRCKHSDFFEYIDKQISIQPGGVVSNRIPLAPKLNGVRFVLTWGLHPPDLDAYLHVPGGPSSYRQVFHGQKGAINEFPFARLEVDSKHSFGPETTTVFQVLPGVYQYFVKQYSSGDGTLPLSDASVAVYFPNGLYGVRHVPVTGAGDVWFVAEYDKMAGNGVGSLRWIDRLLQAIPANGEVSNGSTRGRSSLLGTHLQGISGSPEPGFAGAIYHWTFGDKETSNLREPDHHYLAPGDYPVSLTIMLPDGKVISETKANYIHVYNEKPIVSILSPVKGTLFRTNMTVPIEASAKDLDGTVAYVDVFTKEGGIKTKIGHAETPPYLIDYHPDQRGKHRLIATATDEFGEEGHSEEVEIEVLDLGGDILIIRNVEDPEIAGLIEKLADLRIPDASGFGLPPAVQVLKPTGLYPNLINRFKLIIWDDLGQLDSGIDDSLVELFAGVRQAGIPLYFIGEHLAEAGQRLSSAFYTWQSLVQCGQPTGVSDPGVVELNTENNNRRRLFQQSVSGTPIYYDRPAEVALAFSTNSDVVITIAGGPIMLANPPFREPDFGDARSVSQNCRNYSAQCIPVSGRWAE